MLLGDGCGTKQQNSEGEGKERGGEEERWRETEKEEKGGEARRWKATEGGEKDAEGEGEPTGWHSERRGDRFLGLQIGRSTFRFLETGHFAVLFGIHRNCNTTERCTTYRPRPNTRAKGTRESRYLTWMFVLGQRTNGRTQVSANCNQQAISKCQTPPKHDETIGRILVVVHARS
jgi:hypothetical protein